jgi:hypothetical protein
LSNTSITNLQISDTFQIWINKTNEIIDLANQNVMLAGPGSGFTVTGNSTLVGSFTANTVNSANSTISNLLSVNAFQKSDNIDDVIVSSSPIRIQTGVENIFELATSSGNRPIFKMINGGNARWEIGHSTTAGSSPITIRLEGAASPQLTLTQAGTLIVTALQGNGSNITDINPNNIGTGVIPPANIPNLDASKITSGVFAAARLPVASSTVSGIVTTGNQTIAGAKTFSSTIIGSVSGSAATLTTPRNITIGNTTRSFNGSANVSWTLAEIGAVTNLSIGSSTGTVVRIDSSTGTNATLPAASATLAGVVTTGSQTFAGTKTFSAAVVLSTAGTATTHAVRADRSVSTGTGLTGGGNLTSNRTISIADGGVGTTQLASGERMTTANVLAQTAGASVGAVGTYIIAWNTTTTNVAAGATIAGSNLRYLSSTPTISGETITAPAFSVRSVANSTSFPTANTTSLSGSWRAILASNGRTSFSRPAEVGLDDTIYVWYPSLWLRIS